MNKKKLQTPLAFILIVFMGLLIFGYFIKTSKEPSRKQVSRTVTVVKTVKAVPQTERAIVSAMGSVIPARQITVYPQVAGRVVSIGNDLIPGGHLKKGEKIVKIDPSDYKLAVRQAKAGVSQAELNLASEKGLSEAAKVEWELIKDEVKPTDEGKKLALREIQLESAKTSLSSAQSTLDQALLKLSRTNIKAPFNAFVIDKGVDVGQVISSQTPIATLVDSDKFRVEISLPVENLHWIYIPNNGQKEGSNAHIVYNTGDKTNITREGKVIKLLADLDQRGKTARLLVEINDPFDLKNSAANNQKPTKTNIPLLLGSYVRVEMQGKPIDDVFTLPEAALHNKTTVWIKDSKNKLEYRNVELLWRSGKKVFVKGNLNEGDEIIISRISSPVQGMDISNNPQNTNTSKTGKASGKARTAKEVQP